MSKYGLAKNPIYELAIKVRERGTVFRNRIEWLASDVKAFVMKVNIIIGFPKDKPGDKIGAAFRRHPAH